MRHIAWSADWCRSGVPALRSECVAGHIIKDVEAARYNSRPIAWSRGRLPDVGELTADTAIERGRGSMLPCELCGSSSGRGSMLPCRLCGVASAAGSPLARVPIVVIERLALAAPRSATRNHRARPELDVVTADAVIEPSHGAIVPFHGLSSCRHCPAA